jgi:hypothetical protein
VTPQLLTMVAWSAYILSWIGAAFWADRAEKRPVRREAWLYRAVTIAGVVLLVAGGEQFSRAVDRLWSFEPVVDYALVLVVLSGMAFTWWARLYLGRLWSSSVTKKADHRVVDTAHTPSCAIRSTPASSSPARRPQRSWAPRSLSPAYWSCGSDSGSRHGSRNVSFAANCRKALTTLIVRRSRCWSRLGRAVESGFGRDAKFVLRSPAQAAQRAVFELIVWRSLIRRSAPPSPARGRRDYAAEVCNFSACNSPPIRPFKAL